MANPLKTLNKLGQSPWHDNIRRDLLTGGGLKKMVKDGDITGLTSNPTIFEQAIGQTNIYDEAVAKLALEGKSAAEIFDVLSIEDIQAAADVFAPVFKQTKGADGYVSIEVAPNYARDTQATIKEARRLWKAVNRPNLMVKIPATKEGLPAIEQAITEGINVNVTLIFSIDRYRQVMDAYLWGLERRMKAGKPLKNIASVASFFVSRVDTLVDKKLDAKIQIIESRKASFLATLKGRAAIANAQLAYAAFREVFGTERFKKLAKKGARFQRPLWASTSTKNPAYPDTYYVDALIAPDTVDTMPPATIKAYKDHGKPQVRLTTDTHEAERVVEQLLEFGIPMDEVTQQLEDEGVASFSKSFDTLLAVVETRRQAALLNARQKIHLGKAQKLVEAAVTEMAEAGVPARLWQKDATLWKPDSVDHQNEIRIRMGWLDLAEMMRERVSELTTFAGEVRRAGFTHAVLCGMGGSSLAPEVFRETFGVAKGYLQLYVLDSTDPAAVLSTLSAVDLPRTLFIIASKSGGTAEINAMFRFFWERVSKKKPNRAGENFIAITDPATSLSKLAQERNFRRIFLNPPDIGGRYSALSYFGLVPAALIGVDLAQLLDRAKLMTEACGADVPLARNLGLQLGAALGVLAQEGRDKVTFLTSEGIETFGYWVEQLIAESTGKENKGIVPIEGEALGKPAAYGADRVFVNLQLGKDGAHAKAVKMLAQAGHPVIDIQLADEYDLGGEMLRWEIATALASRVLEINPFDQPNVQEAKESAKQALAEIAATGQLKDTTPIISSAAPDFAERLKKYIALVRPNDYVALMAYFERTPKREKLLRELQATIRDKAKAATTIGYGPRFLHSTGQLHKGGANNGVFIQFIVDDPVDVPIEGEPYTFSQLKQAQALGDYKALAARRRRVIRVNLGAQPERALAKVRDAIKGKK